MRRFPPPWTVKPLDGGFKVVDANGQVLAYVYGLDDSRDAETAKGLTLDEARRIASNIAKLPDVLGKVRPDDNIQAVSTRMSVMRPKTRRPMTSHRTERVRSARMQADLAMILKEFSRAEAMLVAPLAAPFHVKM